MADLLQTIVARKREEVAARKRLVPAGQLADGLSAAGAVRSVRKALAGSESGIIAEFKRRSPSKGWIRRGARPEEVVPAYERAGASALSVLTDGEFFGGSAGDLRVARASCALPVLRKEFIIDEFQLLEARILGADAVLLIAACLAPGQCADLCGRAHELGMEVLLEIHGEEELDYLAAGADMVGVNNRHLGSFRTDVQQSFRLAGALRERAAALPVRPLLVSESGLAEAQTVGDLRKAGFRGFLIGETFMKADDPGRALADFIGGIGKNG